MAIPVLDVWGRRTGARTFIVRYAIARERELA
jgi:hypothetical protein